MSCCLWLTFVWFFLISPVSIVFAENNITGIFSQGIDAFRNMEYGKALELFLAARDSGFNDPRLYYNIGVTYYKLGSYAASYEAMLATKAYPDFAFLAQLNAGLAAVKLERTAVARTHFNAAYLAAKNDKQRMLVKNIADELTILQQPEKKPPLSAFFQAAWGYHDNIGLVNPLLSIDQTNKSDAYASLFALSRITMYEQVSAQASVYSLNYSDANDYDFTDVKAALLLKHPLQWGTTEVSAGAERNYLGDKHLQDIRAATLGVILGQTLSAGGGKKFRSNEGGRLRVRYTHVSIDSSDKQYNHLSGTLQKLSVGVMVMRASTVTLGYFYQYETNDRNDLWRVNVDNSREFISYSPARHTLGLTVAMPAVGSSKISISMQYRVTSYRDASYRDANVILDSSGDVVILPPGVVVPKTRQVIKRHDQRLSLNLRWSFPLTKRLQVFGENDMINNRSNIDKYSYMTTRYHIGFAWTF